MGATSLSQSNQSTILPVGGLIAQYAQITPVDREEAFKSGICLETTEVERLLVIFGTWIGILQNREATVFIDSLITNHTLKLVSNDPHFTQITLSIFREMAKSAFEKQFLMDLSAAVQKNNISIEIHEGISQNSLFNFFSPMRGSCACLVPPRIENIFGYVINRSASYQVHFSIMDRTFTVLEDPKGLWHTEELSLRRVLNHELVHIYHMATGLAARIQKLPKSEQWTDAAERAAIQGDSSDGSVKEEYCENAFAVKRGEYARITHKVCPNIESLPKSKQLLIALALSADGTVQKILREWLEWQFMTDTIEQNISILKQKADSQGNGLVADCMRKVVCESEIELREKLKQKYPNPNRLIISELSAKDIVEAYQPTDPFVSGLTEDDRFTIEQRNHRQRAYQFIQINFAALGRSAIVDEMTTMVDERRADYAVKCKEFREQLIPIIESLDKIRATINKM